MSESVSNNQATIEEEVQGTGAPVLKAPQQNIVILKTSSSTGIPDY